MNTQNNNSQVDKTTDQRVKESIAVRGICSAIQAMSLPTFKSLDEMVNKYGFKLVKIN